MTSNNRKVINLVNDDELEDSNKSKVSRSEHPIIYNVFDNYSPEENDNEVYIIPNETTNDHMDEDDGDEDGDYVHETINMLHQIFSSYDINAIARTVQEFCKTHPDITSSNQIMEYCADILTNSTDEVTVVSSSIPNPNTITTSSSSSSSGISQKKPLTVVQEILIIFPDAKTEYINKLITKYNGSINDIIQDMVDNKYEVEKKVIAPPKDKIDFTSNKWQTSIAYRDCALICLQNDFPFVRVVVIRKLFEDNLFHYYHTVTSIETKSEIKRLQKYPISDEYIRLVWQKTNICVTNGITTKGITK
jgi:hypothetical protein